MKKVFSLMLLLATIFTFTSCGGDDEDEPKTLIETEYSLFAGETISVKGTGLKDVEWESFDKFVAEVQSDAKIVAHKVGRTTINPKTVNGAIHVLVNPNITRYSEPLIRNGAKYINGQLIVTNYNIAPQYIWGTHSSLIPHYIKESGLPWTLKSKTQETMIYSTGNNATPLIGYLFNEDGRMYGTCIYANYLYAEDIPDFLNERFVIYSVDKNNYTADFAHARIDYEDETTINYVGRMALSSSTGYILIMYVADVDNVRSRSVTSDVISIFESAIK